MASSGYGCTREGRTPTAWIPSARRSRSLILAAAALVVAAQMLSRPVAWLRSGSPALALSIASATSTKGESVENAYAKIMLLKADAVFFDVDSTVVKTEGIDLLGSCFGVMKEIAELTHKAMNGNVKFQDALAQRLELMAAHGMTKEKLEECVQTEGKPRWNDGVQEVVKRLKGMGKDVYLVSGGFQNMIQPIAETLNIPMDNVYANTILFDSDGKYAGFDKRAPTCRSGGKPAVLKMLKGKKGYKTMVMVGDGATDMDARTQGPAAAFIGYGGISARPKVIEGADWFVYSFKPILDLLPIAK